MHDAAENGATLLEFFNTNTSVFFVRFCMMNHASVLRVSVMPKESALDIASRGSFPSPGSPYAAASTIMDTLVSEHLELGADDIIPDWDSLKVLHILPCTCNGDVRHSRTISDATAVE